MSLTDAPRKGGDSDRDSTDGDSTDGDGRIDVTPRTPPRIATVMSQLRLLLATRYDTWTVYSAPPATITGDTMFMTFNDIEYHYTAGRTAEIQITLTALVRVSDPATTWERLAELLTPEPTRGVLGAVETNPTLSSVAQLARVSRGRLAAPTQYGEGEYATAEFQIEVLL